MFVQATDFYNEITQSCEEPAHGAASFSPPDQPKNKPKTPSVKLESYSEAIASRAARTRITPHKRQHPLAFSIWSFLPLACNTKENLTQQEEVKPTLKDLPWDKIPVKASQAQAHVREELAGKAGMGEVHFLRMIHLPMKKIDTIHETNPWKFRKNGLFQFRVLQKLEELQPSYFFMEGTHPPKKAEQRVMIPTWDDREKIAAAFSGPLPEEPTEEQIWLLARNTAGPIYQIRHSEVEVLPTTNAQLKQVYMAAYQEMLQRGIRPEDNHPDYIDKVKTPREVFVAKGMVELLLQNPGAKIALVYGAGHRFSDDIKNLGLEPAMTSYFWEFPKTNDFAKVNRVQDGLPPPKK